MSKEMNFGTVVFFNKNLGWGFIAPENKNKDLFVHYSNIVSDAKFKTLEAGQKVCYTIGANKNGPQAEEVTVVAS